LTKIEKVGLAYLSLNRGINSLSGGEAQRIKLAAQFATDLSGVVYILDEPSKGLHAKDYKFLFETIGELKHKGNTVVLVEHNEDFLSCCDDHLVIGPKAGRYGGEVVSFKAIDKKKYKLATKDYKTSKDYTKTNHYIRLYELTTNNLKDISVNIPLNCITSVIGVSGSGKSSLVAQNLYPLLKNTLEGGQGNKQIKVDQQIGGIHYISQKPIGKNSRSNPATYIGLFDEIRKLFAKLPEAKARGLTKEHFSFNSKKGQCDACAGLGEVAISAHFMKDYYTPCSHCKGMKYKSHILDVQYKNHSISDVLNLEVRDAQKLFFDDKAVGVYIDNLMKVGLDYIKLGQSGTTLSGGEAQRIKLAKELTQTDGTPWVYILDEPTSGLHSDDISKLSNVFTCLIDAGHTVVVIEHNQQIIKASDYLIEMGPKGGVDGGYVIQEGFIHES